MMYNHFCRLALGVGLPATDNDSLSGLPTTSCPSISASSLHPSCSGSGLTLCAPKTPRGHPPSAVTPSEPQTPHQGPHTPREGPHTTQDAAPITSRGQPHPTVTGQPAAAAAAEPRAAPQLSYIPSPSSHRHCHPLPLKPTGGDPFAPASKPRLAMACHAGCAHLRRVPQQPCRVLP